MEAPEGKKFYGSITVSERGQIVIPADARKEFGIQTGDKLLIFGDLNTGIWITTFEIMQKTYPDLFRVIGPIKKPENIDESATFRNKTAEDIK